MSEKLYKELPSVSEVLLEVPDDISLHQNYITYIIKKTVAYYRNQVKSKKLSLTRKQIKARILQEIKQHSQPSFKKVINGTGIVLHTGFGRAPFTGKILKRVSQRLEGYGNLEFDLLSGKRGDRLNHINNHLTAITGAEFALMVNNNAAAVLLTLNTLAENKEVIVSRGQQVEIGGSFRIPDIIRKSQCLLKEVGTTNRTHLKDYQNAISSKTGLLLWVHSSNYIIKGFTKEVPLNDLVELGRQKRLSVMADLGSGALLDLTVKTIPYEIPVQDVIKSGASVVTFSGDKLLGGPQAGLIVGKKRIINRIQSNPIYRAVRCDKVTIALMEEVLRTYRSNDVIKDNLAITLLATPRSILKKRGGKILMQLTKARKLRLGIALVETKVEAGSGSLPVIELESIALKFTPQDRKVSELAKQFRTGQVPVVGYSAGNAFYIDLKAVLSNQIQLLISAISQV